MSENDGKIVYSADLDAKQFLDKLTSIEGKIDSLDQVAEKAKFPLTVANWAAGIVVFQKALELGNKLLEQLTDAEKVVRLEKQFNSLAKTAGVVGSELKEALIKAGGGLIDDTELIQVATKGLMNFGSEAKKLPEILTLARKAAASGFGDLSQIFNDLNQAISSGNTKALKQYQIFIDSGKAAEDYARKLGVSVATLTEAGRQQATMNALLTYSQTKFKDVSTESGEFTDSATRLKVSISQLHEAVQKLTLSLGPMLSKVAEWTTEVVQKFTAWVESFDQQSAGAIANRIEEVKNKIASLKAELAEQEADGPSIWDRIIGKNPDAIRAQIQEYEASLTTLNQKQQEVIASSGAASGGGGGSSGPGGPPAVDYKKLSQERSQFEAEILSMRQQRLASEIEMAQSEQQVVLLNDQLVQTINAQRNQQLEELKLKKQESSMTDEQYAQLRVEIESRATNDIAKLNQDLQAKKLAAYQNEVKAAQSATSGITAAFKQGSAQARAELASFGAMGQKTYQNFSSKAVESLMAVGEGTKSASEIAKGFILGMLADEAQARGQLLLLASIFPPNPAGLGAGAGLLILAGALRSMAGGKAGADMGSVSVSSSAGSANEQSNALNGSGLDVASGSASPNAAAFQQPRRQVTVQVQGNYFETEQTRTRLMEMIREATDNTDFRYVQIGGLR